MRDETHYRLLRLLEDEPHLTQRELAKRMDVSLGKINYCLKALMRKGWIKAGNFYRNHNKRAYLYKLTPAGISNKARLTHSFLAAKQREYEQLQAEIEQLSRELESNQECGDLAREGKTK